MRLLTRRRLLRGQDEQEPAGDFKRRRGDAEAAEQRVVGAGVDIEHLAAAMEPGSTAGVLIWENLWAAPFASAARRSGGQLIANGRIPIQAIIASIEADEASTTVGA